MILTEGCPRRALMATPALEVMLRHLYAMIEVERLIAQDSFNRGAA